MKVKIKKASKADNDAGIFVGDIFKAFRSNQDPSKVLLIEKISGSRAKYLKESMNFYISDIDITRYNIFKEDILIEKLKEAADNGTVSLDDFIFNNAKTSNIALLRKDLETFIHVFKPSISRTSEIFITKGTKKGESKLKYFPKVNGYLISHININKLKNIE